MMHVPRGPVSPDPVRAGAAVRLPEGSRLPVGHAVEVADVGRRLDEAVALGDHLHLVHLRVPRQLGPVLDVQVWKGRGEGRGGADWWMMSSPFGRQRCETEMRRFQNVRDGALKLFDAHLQVDDPALLIPWSLAANNMTQIHSQTYGARFIEQLWSKSLPLPWGRLTLVPFTTKPLGHGINNNGVRQVKVLLPYDSAASHASKLYVLDRLKDNFKSAIGVFSFPVVSFYQLDNTD